MKFGGNKITFNQNLPKFRRKKKIWWIKKKDLNKIPYTHITLEKEILGVGKGEHNIEREGCKTPHRFIGADVGHWGYKRNKLCLGEKKKSQTYIVF